MIQAIIADEVLLERKRLRRMLEQMGMDIVSESGNGIHAFNEYRIFKPNVILISLHLPMMDGLTCMRRIKELYHEAIVVVIGHEADRRLIFEALESGADEYLMKPYNPTQVETVIYKTLKEAGLETRTRA